MTHASRTAEGAPHALLLGDMSMAHPLRMAGAAVTVVGGRRAPARFSRHHFGWLPDPRPDDDALVASLVDAGARSGGAALFYQTDADLLLVSRRRAELAHGVRFVLPPPDLVEQLVDKELFAALAQRLGLPTPATRVIIAAEGADAVDLPYPMLIKPRTRDDAWIRHSSGGKAAVVSNRDELERLLGGLRGAHRTVMAQQLVEGLENCIESYHVYIDAHGRRVGDFTGRKVRTRPAVNGFSTALVTTEAADVLATGRDVVRALGLVGVAKLDFKRAPDGTLWLLEVNARFNLWHHLGAVAGVNLPALVLADLTGRPRGPVGPARPGVGWCHVPLDLFAAHDTGARFVDWVRWWRQCGSVVAGLDVADPLPFVRGHVLPRIGRRIRRVSRSEPAR